MGVISYLKSTILSKIVMAVTGVILVLFVMGHMIGNLQVFIGKETFNAYAHFLQSLGEILWIIRILLIICLILHIITSVYLKFSTMSARPVDYKFRKYVAAKLTARTMIWTGIMIFAFLVYHLLHFTMGKIMPEYYGQKDYYERQASFVIQNPAGDVAYETQNYSHAEGSKVLFERHDAYFMVVKGFQNPFISISYIIGVILLGFHLTHAIQSMFQTLGISGPRFTPVMVKTSNILSILITLGYISIPLFILMRMAGGNL